MSQAVEFDEVRALAEGQGLSLLGILSDFTLPAEAASLLKWQEKGYAGEMGYMERSSDLLTDPRKMLPSVKTILMCAVRYEQQKHPERTAGFGRVARYAWGKDYHLVLRERLKNIAQSFEKHGIAARPFTDAVPLMERPLAARAGLGFVGRHTLLIIPKVGSLFLLGEILLDCEIKNVPVLKEMPGCGTCSNCKDTCPTQAIVSDYVVDARRCISYLTIEKKGMLSIQERSMVGEWIFGCDECQEICPFNHSPIKIGNRPDLEAFRMEEGVGPLVNLKELFGIRTDEEFRVRFKGTPLLRTKRHGLIRNGICVAVNTNSERVLPEIQECLDDASGIVRATAYWGLRSFAEKGALSSNSLRNIQELLLADTDPNVQAELACT